MEKDNHLKLPWTLIQKITLNQQCLKTLTSGTDLLEEIVSLLQLSLIKMQMKMFQSYQSNTTLLLKLLKFTIKLKLFFTILERLIYPTVVKKEKKSMKKWNKNKMMIMSRKMNLKVVLKYKKMKLKKILMEIKKQAKFFLNMKTNEF